MSRRVEGSEISQNPNQGDAQTNAEPNIVPSTKRRYAHISSAEIKRLKDKNRPPITERIFGDFSEQRRIIVTKAPVLGDVASRETR